MGEKMEMDLTFTERGTSEELVWIQGDELANYYIVPVSVAGRLSDLPEHMMHVVEIMEAERRGKG